MTKIFLWYAIALIRRTTTMALAAVPWCHIFYIWASHSSADYHNGLPLVNCDGYHFVLGLVGGGLLAVLQKEHLCSRDLDETWDSNYIAGVLWGLKSFFSSLLSPAKKDFFAVIEHNIVISSPFQQFTHPADTEQHLHLLAFGVMFLSTWQRLNIYPSTPTCVWNIWLTVS